MVERIAKLKDLSDWLTAKMKDVEARTKEAVEEENPWDETYWKGVKDTLQDVQKFLN